MWDLGVSVCDTMKMLNLRIVADILFLKRIFFKINTEMIFF